MSRNFNDRPVTGSPTRRALGVVLAVAFLALAGSAAPALAGNVPDGEQAGYTTSGSLEQVVEVSPGDSCTFSMWVGKRSDGAGIWGRWFVQLTTGGWNIQNVMNGSLAAQADQWALYEMTFTVGSFPNLPIKLRLKGQWGFESYDLVALDCGGGSNLLLNPSFESPVIPEGTWTTFGSPAPDAWTTVGGGAGVFHPNTTQMADFFDSFSDWLVGTPCNGTDFGGGCTPDETGYHFVGIFNDHACWWHTKNQAWNTTTATNTYNLALTFGLDPTTGTNSWCHSLASTPTPPLFTTSYQDPSNVGAWGWCGGAPFTSGGFVCFATP